MSNCRINRITKHLTALTMLILFHLLTPAAYSIESDKKTDTKTVIITPDINSGLIGHHLDYWVNPDTTAKIDDVLLLKEQSWTKLDKGRLFNAQ